MVLQLSSNVICATQIMSGTQPDTCTNALAGINILQLEDHGLSKSDLTDKQFSVLRKCRSQFDCLIFEMLFIKELKPRRTPFVLNCLRDTGCKYFLAFNSALFYSLRICFLYIYIQITFFSFILT